LKNPEYILTFALEQTIKKLVEKQQQGEQGPSMSIDELLKLCFNLAVAGQKIVGKI